MCHNCKPGLYADEAFIFRKDCNQDIPFVNAKFMQAFEYTKSKKIKHKNSNKCLEMGEESSRTFSPVHT